MENKKTILDDLLENIKEDELDSQIKIICDQIQQEEDEKGFNESSEFRPDYPNIFLVLDAKKANNSYNYVTLEREIPGKYIIGLWNKSTVNEKSTKRVNAWDVKEVKPKKIIQEFAKVYKIYK